MSDELVVLSMRALACAAKAREGRLTDADMLALLVDLVVHAPGDEAWRAVLLGFEAARHADQEEAGRLLEAWLVVRSQALAEQAARLRTALAACAPLDAPKPDAPKPDAPKPDAPKPDAPKPDAPKPDAPVPLEGAA